MLAGALAFGAMGLLGSFHCAGMCGGFAVGVAVASGPRRRRILIDQFVFAIGKALTYVILGLALRSALAQAVDASGLAVLQEVLSLGAGVVLVLGGLKLMGLNPMGLITYGQRGKWTRGIFKLYSRAQSGVRALGGRAAAFGTGALTGFLPCGLSWSAFALATQVTAPVAALGLFLFGLGTSPALILVGLGGRRLLAHGSGKNRLIGVRVAGVLLILFGILTALRGGWTVEDALAGTPAPCCTSPGHGPDAHSDGSSPLTPETNQ